MLFHINRASLNDDEKPCEEAIKQQYVVTESYTDKEFANVPIFNRDINWFWFRIGYNHKHENDIYSRCFNEEGWFVEIKSLEELLDFETKYGSIIMDTQVGQTKQDNISMGGITIYDDYVE